MKPQTTRTIGMPNRSHRIKLMGNLRTKEWVKEFMWLSHLNGVGCLLFDVWHIVGRSLPLRKIVSFRPHVQEQEASLSLKEHLLQLYC